jgi:hypothetical protein
MCLFLIGRRMFMMPISYSMCGWKVIHTHFCVWMKNELHPPAEHVMDVKDVWLHPLLASRLLDTTLALTYLLVVFRN